MPRSALLPALVGLLLSIFAVGPAVPASAATAPSFRVGPLPQATGVTYAAGVTRNEDIEPGMGVAGDGTFWVGSNIDVNTSGDPRSAAAVAGEDIWKSTNGGLDYQWVAAPFNPTSSTPGAGGEDSDLAVAPERNAQGFYNVYAASLYVAASNMAISQDGGKTWTLMSIGGIPAQDRPWLSVDGPCTFYLTYHQLPLFAPVVNRYDACNPANVGMGVAMNPVQSTPIFLANTAPGFTNGFNKPFVDNSPTSPHRHNLYVPMEACNLAQPADFFNNVVVTAEQVPVCPQGVVTEVEVAVSSDQGATFNDYIVALNTNGEQQVWPTSLAVDAAGTVYVSWSDNHHSFFSRSTDAGVTWSKPTQVDGAPIGTSVYPTVAAGAAGAVDVAYYGTAVPGDTNDAKAMGAPGKPTSAPWHLYFAKSSDGGATFTTTTVSGVNHTGVLCTKGSACAGDGSRNLYDDFGVTISPTSGRAGIAFDADQPLATIPATAPVDPFTAFATELGPVTGPAPALASAPTPAVAATPLPGTSAGYGAQGWPVPVGFLLLAVGAMALALWGKRHRARL